MDAQRRIADFLDEQVVLLDHAIDLRKQQDALFRNLLWSSFEFAVDTATSAHTPLNRYFSLTADGPFGSAFSSSDYSTDGPAVIRLGNISFAEFRRDDLARVPVDIWQRFPRSQVQPGDLLIASLGDANNHAGRACLAPDDLGPAMVKGKCFRARVNPATADPTFLSLAMSSPRGAELFSLEARGATRSMINLDILGAVRLPIPDLVTQRAIAAEAVDLREDQRRQSALVRRSVDLLQERKQALITAAVTGQLDVTTARSGLSVDVP